MNSIMRSGSIIKKTGRKLYIDWRNIGGTADIVRYISDRFEAVCRENREKTGHKWDAQTAKDYKNPACIMLCRSYPESALLRSLNPVIELPPCGRIRHLTLNSNIKI